MITIGFSTREVDEKFIRSIEKSCGIKNIEIIPFENKGTHSLTEVYNIILDKSSNDIVVLCHDDIYFNTKGWGKNLINHFNNSDYGILGLAGTTHLSDTGRWWDDFNKMVGIVNHQDNKKKWKSQYSNDFKSDIIETVILDGVFLSLHKKRIKNKFDENVKGFHFYDVDFTFSNHIEDVKTGVIFDVRITHLSIGQTNSEWENNRIEFKDKFKKYLPYNITPKISFKDVNVSLKETPKVTIIIPNKNNFDLLYQCIKSYEQKSNYKNYDIVIADTGSDDDILDRIKNLQTIHKNLTVVEYDYYNFAKINNDIVKNHIDKNTELLLFSNNDIQILNDVITQMVDLYNQNKKRIGTIGCRLHYGDNTVQHSGISISQLKNTLIHLSHFGLKSSYVYFEGKKEVFGNTAALMMIDKGLFKDIGGFNEDYIECFEDVELNIECLKRKKVNMIEGNAVAYHFESQTRDENKNKNKNMTIDYNHRLLKIIVENIDIIKKYIYKKVF